MEKKASIFFLLRFSFHWEGTASNTWMYLKSFTVCLSENVSEGSTNSVAKAMYEKHGWAEARALLLVDWKSFLSADVDRLWSFHCCFHLPGSWKLYHFCHGFQLLGWELSVQIRASVFACSWMLGSFPLEKKDALLLRVSVELASCCLVSIRSCDKGWCWNHLSKDGSLFCFECKS